MLIYEGTDFENYIKNELKINTEWIPRDFSDCVKKYLESSTHKVLAVGGLRGTGKTTGIIQAARGMDCCYILALKNDTDISGQDYINFIKKTDRKIIIIDEYSWINDRRDLDYYLATAVYKGKRVVITGTESISLDFLNYSTLNHRVSMLHTTMFTYDEYLRVFKKEHNKSSCYEYLKSGGLFKDHILKTFDDMKDYVEEAVVYNLANYLKNEIDVRAARTLTYSVLYKAVCESNLVRVPTLRKKSVTLDNFLEDMGIDADMQINQRYLNRVADIFEHVGIIVRVPNFQNDSVLKEQYYITNPSITYHLILHTYKLRDLDDGILGHLFEAAAMVQLATNKIDEHDIYFFNNTGIADDKKNKELDILLTDHSKNYAYLFECKNSQNDSIKNGITLLSGDLEKYYLKDIDIIGRYVIYNGKPVVKGYDIGKVVFTSLAGDIIDNYFSFEENAAMIIADKRKNRENKSHSFYYKKVFPDFDYNLPILPSWNDSTERSDGIPSMSLEYKGHTLKLFFDYNDENKRCKDSKGFPRKKYRLFVGRMKIKETDDFLEMNNYALNIINGTYELSNIVNSLTNPQK